MITYISSRSLIDAMTVFPFLKDLDRYYPDIGDWYVNKVIPGIVQGRDGLIIAKENEIPIGVALYKSRMDEKKLRCIRVLPSHKNRGIGLHLIDRSLKEMRCDRPVISVAEELIHDYSRILINRYGFNISHVYRGIYRPSKLEYEFNGRCNLTDDTPYGETT